MRFLKFFAVFIAFALTLTISSSDAREKCKKEGKCDKGEKAEYKAIAVPTDMIGKKVKCPVSEEEFSVSKDTVFSTYKGKNYYFCCPDCKSKFDKEPKKYVKEEKKPKKKK